MGRMIELFRSRLSARFVLLTLLLLVVIQAAGFLIVRATVDKHVREEVHNAIKVSERIWERTLKQTHEPLQEGAEVLATDFGFRSAVASQDQNTIASALENSALRIDATVAILVDARWRIKASSKPDMMVSDDLKLLVKQLADVLKIQRQPSSLVALYQGKPTQFVVAPIRAPRLVGYVVMGFAIEQSLIEEASELAGVEMTLLATTENEMTSMLASNAVIAEYFKDPNNRQTLQLSSILDFEIGDDIYVSAVHAMPVIGGFINNVFMKSLNDASARFDRLEEQYVYITGVGLAVFALVITWLSRRVTSPLVALTSATAALEKGDFNVQVHGAKRADEIGVLARSFDGMRHSLSEQSEKITQLAYFDPLTSLPNRIHFRSFVEQTIQSGEHPHFSIITVNLDRFKQINDVLGYEMGDLILKATASRLQQVEADNVTLVAHLSADEFALLVTQGNMSDWQVAQAVRQSLDEPLEINDTQIDLSASIGIATWPEDAKGCDNLINASQVAMYAAKVKREDVVIYKNDLVTSAPENLSLLSELRRAVRDDELRVFLQPKVDTKTHAVIAAEALIRWQHPENGMVAPYLFVPFAEQTGFVRELTKWMLRSVAKNWHDLQRENAPLRISVNLSTRDLMTPSLPSFLAQILQDYDVPASGLCLEITESAIMDDPTFAEQTLAKLSQMGFRLSIDDFGTGYSSLGYLKRLPVNELKVDQSFVFGMIDNPNDRVIVQSTIDLAHNLGLDVVAEGVETDEMYHALCTLGCEEAQGYLIGKPMPIEEFKIWRQKWEQDHGI